MNPMHPVDPDDDSLLEMAEYVKARLRQARFADPAWIELPEGGIYEWDGPARERFKAELSRRLADMDQK